MTFLVRFIFLAACSGPPVPARPLPMDTLPPVHSARMPPPPPIDTLPLAGLPVDSLTQAGVAFVGVLPDSTVLALLRRYHLRPYMVRYQMADGPSLHDTPPDSARLELIAETRRRVVQGSATFPCMLQARFRQMRSAERNVRPAPGEPDRVGRMQLARIESIRANGERLARGEPFVWGLKVMGHAGDLLRLARDPLVRSFQPPRRTVNGPPYVPTPEPLPGMERGPPRSPEVDRMTDEEVQARLDALAREPLPGCEAIDRNVRETGVAERVAPGTTIAEGLAFRATSRLAPESRANARGVADVQTPVSVHTTVTVTNTSNRRVETGIRGCTVLLRAYRTPNRTGTPAWDQSRRIGCAQDPMRLSLAPGESRQLDAGASAWHVLSDSTPPGRYYFTALFRLADRTLELPAGDVELTPRQEGLAYRATSRLVQGSLETRATITNTTLRPIYIEYGACSLVVRAYRTPARSGQPAWRSDRRGTVCPLYLATYTLAPGETFSPGEFTERVPIGEILADSLPDGRYYFSANLRLNFRPTPEFPAGEAELAMPRPPLPTTRTRDAVTYRTETEVIARSPLTIRTVVTATLTAAGGSRLRYSADCPVTLLAYRERGRRDSAPRSGEPDWKSSRRCGPELQQMWLSRGESRTFEVRATGREILGGSLPPGRYYLAVAVQTEGQRILLSAGEANLTR